MDENVKTQNFVVTYGCRKGEGVAAESNLVEAYS